MESRVTIRTRLGSSEKETILPFEEGYYGGTESEKETTTWNSGCADTDEEMSDAEEAELNQCNDYNAVHEYVASFSDDIASEEFVRIVDDYNVGGGFCVNGDITEIDDDFSEKNQQEFEQFAEQEEGNHYSDADYNLQSDQDVPSCDLGDCGCVTIELAQEICPKYLEVETIGYKKRQRARKGAVRSNCRNPRDMGAIEIALRTSGNRKNQPIFEPVRGMVFD
ncbi:uncharacterized protein LOC120674897 [Panicum virgatum]|uniref:Uncharacterized protein n=1 Tax=Panicum virgatum TaxID=38727 RepID=A0A8T0S1A0_PANVG|nr:uncharacterized protein LOC120674897 [Panicum virgatum]KAG2590596.1 hypothetical protein PVAP13_5NG418080 [Panicum virgatum]